MVRKPDPDRKDKFLEAALRLFVASGVPNTSTAEIAREAGTAAGTLFLYFPTKQDLIHALVLKISREQSEYIQGLLSAELPARETFWTIWQGSVQWFLDHPQAYRYVQQVRDSGMITESVAQESGRDLAYYYQAVQKGLDEGAIRPYPAELVGGLLYQDIVAVMNLIITQSGTQDEIIRQGFEIFWNGIKAEGIK